MNKSKIGERIKATRIENDIKQCQLAEQIGVNSKYLSAIECGAKQPSLDLLIDIANALGASTDYLLSDYLNTQVLFRNSPLSKQLLSLSEEQLRKLINLIDILIRTEIL